MNTSLSKSPQPIEAKPLRRHPLNILGNDSGSMRMSLGLIVAMVLMIAIFSLIDYVDKNSNTSSAPDSSRGFNETVEGEFFDDAKYQDQMQVTEPQAKPLDQLTPEDVDPTLDPKYQETNAKNTFYHPLTEEQKREKEKIKKQRANKVGM